MAGLSSILFGAPGQTTQLERFGPQQKEAFNQMLAMAMGGLQETDLSFEPIAERARTQLEQRIIPTIAERFTAAGPGAIESAAFPRALGEAGAGLEEGLAALRSQYGLDKFEQFQRLASLGLTPQFESIYSPEEPGFLQTAGAGLGGGLARTLPTLLGGLGGGAAPSRPGAALAPAIGALGAAQAPLTPMAGKMMGAMPSTAAGIGGAAAKAKSTLGALGALAPGLGVIGGGLGFMKLLQYLVRRKGKKRSRRR